MAIKQELIKKESNKNWCISKWIMSPSMQLLSRIHTYFPIYEIFHFKTDFGVSVWAQT